MCIRDSLYEGDVYVIEVNPRSSRTVPFLSKITDVPMANLATKAILGQKLKDLGYQNGLVPEKEGIYAVSYTHLDVYKRQRSSRFYNGRNRRWNCR